MRCTEMLKARVSLEIKRQAKVLADRELVTESAWLKRLVIREIRAGNGALGGERKSGGFDKHRRANHDSLNAEGHARPIFVRLMTEDRLLLGARAEAQGLRPATFVSVLLRAHLRSLTPLPKDELLALKQSISELASIGRNINQIAKALNAGKAPESVRLEFRTMLKICEALRDHTKALLKANETAWRTGHVHADR